MIRLIFSLFMVAVLCIGGYLWFARIEIAQNLLAEKLQTPVTLENISYDFQAIHFKNLTILTSSKETVPFAFKAEKISVEMGLLELFKQEPYVKEVRVQNGVLGLELLSKGGDKNNWMEYLKRQPKKDGKKCHLNVIRLYNLKFETRFKGQSLQIAPIEYLEVSPTTTLTFVEMNHEMIESIFSRLRGYPALSLLSTGLKDAAVSSQKKEGYLKQSVDFMREKVGEAREFIENLF